MLITTKVLEQMQIDNIHFIGIGGTGMCGIAEVLHNAKYRVTGSDSSCNKAVLRLQTQGVKIQIGHEIDLIKEAKIVVYSTAISKINPEYEYARKNLIPLLRRAEMLAELMRDKRAIAVAGTHGKTTTTSLISAIFIEANLDPTFVVGGLVKQAKSNAKLGSGEYMILEADESDSSFYHLHPSVSVVTNIDCDHMEHYKGDYKKYKKSFINFLHNLPFYGYAVICIDDAGINSIIQKISRTVITYGFHDEATYRVKDDEYSEDHSKFTVERGLQQKPLQVSLALAGRHNVLNATAAIAVATAEGIADKYIKTALQKFQGVARRFETIGKHNIFRDENPILIVDDYGHHPTEIRAVLESIATGYRNKNVIMIFQPHRYSRLKEFFEDFVDTLVNVQQLIVIDVYSAGESLIPQYDSKSLCRALRQRGAEPIYTASFQNIPQIVYKQLQPNSIVLTQGAGNITQLAKEINSYFEDVSRV